MYTLHVSHMNKHNVIKVQTQCQIAICIASLHKERFNEEIFPAKKSRHSAKWLAYTNSVQLAN